MFAFALLSVLPGQAGPLGILRVAPGGTPMVYRLMGWRPPLSAQFPQLSWALLRLVP
jgi:hypothetical protein